MEETRTFVKPYESGNGGDQSVRYSDYIGKYIKSQNDEGFYAKYAVGVTFGADLAKWSDILSVIFHYDNNGPVYNSVKNFNQNALLITDSVFIKNHNTDIGDMQAENLNIWMWKEEPYLHTKFILIRMEQNINIGEPDMVVRFLLFVSSKNLSNSNNLDMIVPLVSVEPVSGVPSYGQIIKEYLEFLKEKCCVGKEEDDLAKASFEGLSKTDFEMINNDKEEYTGKLEDLQISYDVKRFTDDIWENGICSCDRIISPYISDKELETVDRSAKTADQADRSKEIRILTYQSTYNDLNTNPQNTELKFYVGNNKGEAGGGRYKFHVKFYMKTENNKTVIYFGSANLTTEARTKHCEMILKISFNDNKRLYNTISSQFFSIGNNNWICKPDKVLSENPDEDDEVENAGTNRTSEYALSCKGEKYQWYRVTKETEFLKEVKKGELSHFVKSEDFNDFYVCRTNYCSNPEYELKDGWNWIEYESFTEIVEKNKKQNLQSYYRNLLLNPGKNPGDVQKKGDKKRGRKKTPIIPKYPCLYRMLHTQDRTDLESAVKELIATSMDENDSDNSIVLLMKRFIGREE